METEQTKAEGSLPSAYEIAKEQKSKMVRKLFYLAYCMGYEIPRTEAQKRMSKKDVCRVNLQTWLSGKHCSINKNINRYIVDELVIVLSQFEQVYKSFTEQYNKEKEA